ncbi:MAG: hypothetical protein ABMA01_05430 [Chthoniobacteraceae bacterium]
MNTTALPRCLALALFVSAFSLPAAAQSVWPRIYSDAELRARAEAEARAQPGPVPQPQNPVQIRQSQIVHELQCLKNTTSVLHRSFIGHLRTCRVASDSPDADLAEGLGDLVESVDRLSSDVLGAGRGSRGQSSSQIYRSFHKVEYGVEDARALAVQAGYSRGMREYFSDIDQHLRVLGECGLRNPRLGRIGKDTHAHHEYGRAEREQQIALPQVPRYQPGVVPRHQATTIDLGDFLGKLFKGKSR